MRVHLAIASDVTTMHPGTIDHHWTGVRTATKLLNQSNYYEGDVDPGFVNDGGVDVPADADASAVIV
jgi:hypothetical protein